MHRFTASIGSLFALSLLLAGVAACSGPIVDPPVSGGPGLGDAPGGGRPIARTVCLPGEAIIVAAASPERTVVAVQSAGTWQESLFRLPPSSESVAYVDDAGAISVLWIDQLYGIDHTHIMKSSDGVYFEAHAVVGWHPESSTRILDVTPRYLVDTDDSGTGMALLDPSTLEWSPFTSTLLVATSFAIRSRGLAMTLIGPGEDGELCEHSYSLFAHFWHEPICHPEIPVASAEHAPIVGPRLVTLPNADVVAVHFPAGTSSTLGATVLRDDDYQGRWSKPVTITSPAIGASFAAAVTSVGDVIVGVVSPLGEVSAIRFSPARGWSVPVPIDTGASPGQQISVATGICGDDAVIAYAAGGSDGEVRVARVRGDATEVTTVARLHDDRPYRLSIATRAGQLPPSD